MYNLLDLLQGIETPERSPSLLGSAPSLSSMVDPNTFGPSHVDFSGETGIIDPFTGAPPIPATGPIPAAAPGPPELPPPAALASIIDPFTGEPATGEPAIPAADPPAPPPAALAAMRPAFRTLSPIMDPFTGAPAVAADDVAPAASSASRDAAAVAPVAAAPAEPPAKAKHSFWNDDYSPRQRWMMLGAGLRDMGRDLDGRDGADDLAKTEALILARNKVLTDEATAEQSRKDRAALVAGNPNMSAEQKWIFAYGDPDEVVKSAMKGMEPHSAGPGGTLYTPLGVRAQQMAPKPGLYGNIPVMQTERGTVVGAPLPPSYADTTNRWREINQAGYNRARLDQPDIGMAAGTDEHGNQVYFDRHTGHEFSGGIALHEKPGTAGHQSVWSQKFALYQGMGMSDQAAAQAASKGAMSQETKVSLAQQRASGRIAAGDGGGEPGAYQRFYQEALGELNNADALRDVPPPAGGHYAPPAAPGGHYDADHLPDRAVAAVRSRPAGAVTTLANGHRYTMRPDRTIQRLD